MTVDEAIETFATTRELPLDTLAWAKEHWDDMVPRARALLDALTDGSDRSEAAATAAFFLVHLAGEQHETQLHVPLCRMLPDPDLSDMVLSDAVTESLPGILINTYDGDPAALQSVVEAATGDGFVRGGALLALAWLTRTGRLTDDWMRGYLGRLYATMQPQRADLVWTEWASAVSILGYADMEPQVESAFRRGLIEAGVMRLKHFRDDLRVSQKDPTGMAGFVHAKIEPFEDTAAFLSDWQFGEPADAAADDPGAGYVPQMPIVNPLRHVGRNDPCPCGSGKKYKKCCLAA